MRDPIDFTFHQRHRLLPVRAQSMKTITARRVE